MADPSVVILPGQAYTFDAAILDLDLVNFTSFTESMASLGPRGTETLKRILDEVLGALVEAAHAFGGDILRFSGDSIICMWLAGDAPGARASHPALLACAAALNMRALMADFAHVDTPLGPVRLEIRLGVGYGPTTILVVGDANQQQLALAGPALNAAAQAEIAAQPNQVRLHPSVLDVVGAELAIGADYVLDHLLNAEPSVRPSRWPAVDERLLHPFIHPVLIDRPLEFVAEFRSAVSMFIECDDRHSGGDLSAWFSAWVQAAQADIHRFGGWLCHVEISSKGNVLLVQFGAPIAHEDNERRAIACALALRETSAALFPTLQLHIGLTCGRLFMGTVGSPDRHAYTLIGDEINLAARLMEIALPGQIIVSARVRDAAANHFTFRDLGSVRVRGKSQAAPVHAVVQASRPQQEFIDQYLDYRQRLIGREREMSLVEAALEQAWAGQGQLVTVSGEAGIGKSHLVSELIHRWVARGGVAVGGNCLSFAAETPYLPWRWIVSARCGLTSDMDQAAQIEKLARALAALPVNAKEERDYWLLRLPLVTEVVGLDVPDNDLTYGLQEQARRDNTFAAIQALLRSGSDQTPCLILIEDAHWADDLSLQLAALVAQDAETGRLLFVLVHRPLPQPTPAVWQAIQVARHTRIELSELTREASRSLVHKYLDCASVPDELVHLVFERAQGHPFFTEEILRMFQDLGCIRLVNSALVFEQERAASIHFPDTVEGVIQARVDKLHEGDRLTLKVASVVGRLFPYRVLAGIYPAQVAPAELQTHLDTLEQLGLTLLEQLSPEREYVFKHSITQEVVYEGLVFAQRQSLHKAVARWYEAQYASNLEPFYSLLAYHYGRAEESERELHYLLLAANYAMHIHAINEAIRHYERALTLMEARREPAHVASVLMRLATCVHFTGQYERAREHCQQALELYEQAQDAVGAAEACFEIADHLVVHDLEAALEYVTRGLDHVQGRSDAHPQLIIGYADLAAIQRNMGNHEQARQSLQAALSLAQETRDLNGLWKCYQALSLDHYSRGEKRQAFEAGQLMVQYVEQAQAPVQCHIIGLNNLASYAQGLGDLQSALEAGQAGLALARRAGIISEQVILASTMAEIYNHMGDWPAAERVMNDGLDLLAHRPHPYHTVALHAEAGQTAYGQEKWEKAIEHWSRAEAESRGGTPQVFRAGLCAQLSMAWLQLGDLAAAQAWASQARSLAEQREQRGALAQSWRAHGMIEHARRNWPAAQAAFKRALELAEALNDPVETARTLLEYGRLLLAAGQGEQGRDLLHQAEQQATAISLLSIAQAARILLAAP